MRLSGSDNDNDPNAVAHHRIDQKGSDMLILGLVLMLIGFVAGIPVLWTIGIILAIVGAVLLLAERSGAAWGRRWY